MAIVATPLRTCCAFPFYWTPQHCPAVDRLGEPLLRGESSSHGNARLKSRQPDVPAKSFCRVLIGVCRVSISVVWFWLAFVGFRFLLSGFDSNLSGFDFHCRVLIGYCLVSIFIVGFSKFCCCRFCEHPHRTHCHWRLSPEERLKRMLGLVSSLYVVLHCGLLSK